MTDTPPSSVPPAPCGNSWKADYGNLPCDKPKGHEGMHRTYGSQGPILWQDIKPCKRHSWERKNLERKCVKCGKRQVWRYDR